ncbi:hypothetical protein A2954_00405 [Candidatus Roizmanbacteria bacterium RIFCSPLOWO2_01_FULL_37_12]|uniref:Uncharacterized protein n=1 Tax=Candidatus Roizmanbacteria bacterium RIFCSPLOWO2_01_FULL_37_12 TaxID=1802056 RepID=A0A1F7IB85_9BACT|nr:MAG: hypothetical protein A2768_00380 [Candidatus Roizmanbacteria bacterium RIFCSPHIGHO2_01_FULL_37_16]OGK25474.1 MAG: hypothetical protein A3D76_06865 [Candidatus Roizmanbacteria bacterium RIFCSPHIGHO2_02_FULL_37_9b]OGK40621.1 MAG: hypothetical protein A2954_00405 [Candidatus Roizmanbacteria bacterium RIFCSPLOWO2_01_FULL_37_12]
MVFNELVRQNINPESLTILSSIAAFALAKFTDQQIKDEKSLINRWTMKIHNLTDTINTLILKIATTKRDNQKIYQAKKARINSHNRLSGYLKKIHDKNRHMTR